MPRGSHLRMPWTGHSTSCRASGEGPEAPGQHASCSCRAAGLQGDVGLTPGPSPSLIPANWGQSLTNSEP